MICVHGQEHEDKVLSGKKKRKVKGSIAITRKDKKAFLAQLAAGGVNTHE